MKKFKIAHYVLSIIAGVLLIGYGGMDDSPGAQGIGLLTALGSVVGIYLVAKKDSAS